MKNNIILIMTGIILFVSNAFAFTDLTSDHTYNEAINFIKENNIVQGYPDGTFKPDNQINRAELLKIIIESKFTDEEINSALDDYKAKNYTYVDLYDVNINDWFAPYVRIAIKEGIVEGYADGNFRPSQNVNFVEALKIVLKTYGISYDENATPWYKDLVDKGAENNLNPLDITSFDLNITRAQMADLITRVIKYKNGTLSDYLKDSVGIKQTYSAIQNGETNIADFVSRNIESSDVSDEEMTDCGTQLLASEVTSGFDCITNAIQESKPAKLNEVFESTKNGIKYYFSYLDEYRGIEDGESVFYTILTDFSITYPDGYAENIIEKNIRESAESMIGLDMNCLLPTEDLVEIIQNKIDDLPLKSFINFGSGAEDEKKLEDYDCTGSYINK